MRAFSQFLVFLLMIDAAWVAYGLYMQRVMWKWIVLYWVILTAKNAVDLCGGIKHGRHG